MEAHPDIRKMGALKKLKTQRRKWFVLWQDGQTGQARLEYYDSEKKFRTGGPAKRTIPIRACFNINKKSDTKHKHAIALYTKDDCFSIMCDSKEDQESWLEVMLELLAEGAEDSDDPRPLFEHIWQVTVKPRGLAGSRGINPGSYRLCLTNSTLSLVRVNHNEPDVIFQLASIRRCGHSDCFFFMEVGRSAITGPGELWMQVEDTVIAQNMHEAILSSMRTSTLSAELQPTIRPRSCSSAAERTRPASTVGRGGTAGMGYESATLPKRSKTISEPHSSSPMRHRKSPGRHGSLRATSALFPRHSPNTTSPLSQSLLEQGMDGGHRIRTDSMESRGSRGTTSSISIEEYDEQLPSGSGSTRSVTPDGSLRETEYYTMSPPGKDQPPTPGSELDGYMAMSPGTTSSTPGEPESSGYIDMSPGGIPEGYMDMSPMNCSVSPVPSTASSQSNIDNEEKGYLDMTPIARSLPTVQERRMLDGYMTMQSSGHSPRTGGNFLRPDKVYSFLADDAVTEDFPKRAYSVGSKPVVTHVKEKEVPPDPNLDKANSKSNSAPHLPDKEKQLKNEATSKAAKGKDEHFMEMDFMEIRSRTDSCSSTRSRTSSGGQKDLRARTSSLSQQDFRPRTGSTGSVNRDRTSSCGKLDKPQHLKERIQKGTATQDNMRPRTSSCGQDYRPRASSWSNSKLKRFSKDSSSHESLTKTLFGSLRRKSHEFLHKHLDKSGYLDMTPPTNKTGGAAGKIDDKSGYLDMSVSPSCAASITEEYQEMEYAPSPVKPASPVHKPETVKESYMEMSPSSAGKQGYANIAYKKASPQSLRKDSTRQTLSVTLVPKQKRSKSPNLALSATATVLEEPASQETSGQPLEQALHSVKISKPVMVDPFNLTTQKALPVSEEQDSYMMYETKSPTTGGQSPAPKLEKVSSPIVDTSETKPAFTPQKPESRKVGQTSVSSSDRRSSGQTLLGMNSKQSEKSPRSTSPHKGGTSPVIVNSRESTKRSLPVPAKTSQAPTLQIDNNDTAGYMDMSFPAKKDNKSSSIRERNLPTSPQNVCKAPSLPDSCVLSPVKSQPHASMKDPVSSAERRRNLSSSSSDSSRKGPALSPVECSTRKSTEKLFTIGGGQMSPGICVTQDVMGISRKWSSSSLPGSVEVAKRSSSSGSEPSCDLLSPGIKRQSIQDGSVFPDPKGMSRNSSKASLSGDRELNYAALDLSEPSEDSKRFSGSRIHSQASSHSSLANQEEEDDAPLRYAQIDFSKSTGLKHASSLKDMKSANS